MNKPGYDLIGDVHGCGRTLRNLLVRLGYRQEQGVYRHPLRQAIFIGDIVDRGRHVREALAVVRAMVEAGSALMVIGNHEYNAIGWHHRRVDGSHVRDHSPRHNRQIRETLEQFHGHEAEWRDHLAWFRQLPLWLELDGFRVVHACWDEGLIGELKRRGIRDFSRDDFLEASAEHGSFAWQVADRLLRGTYLPLPNGEVMVSRDGFRRRFYRTRFWPGPNRVHRDVAFQPDPLPPHLAHLRLSSAEKARLISYGPEQPLLFIGHYWQTGRPGPLAENIICLDYSAVRGGSLVAYRWIAGEPVSTRRFVAEPVVGSDLPLEDERC